MFFKENKKVGNKEKRYKVAKEQNFP